MTVNNTDTFLVERSGTSYKLEAQNLMADLLDTDLMLVERSGTSYKATGLDIKDSLGSNLYPNFEIDDCFKTFYYTGNGSSQSFTTGFDCRASAGGCLILFADINSGSAVTYFADTEMGTGKLARWTQTTLPSSVTNGVTSFDSNGFTIGSNGNINTNNATYRCQVFKVHEGFFDMQTYGPSSSSSTPTTVNHNLGAQPCMIMFRNQGMAQANMHYRIGGITTYSEHGAQNNLTIQDGFMTTEPTSTSFTVASAQSNRAGDEYIAYIFGGQPGGAGVDYPVTFGTYMGYGTEIITNTTKPQFALFKAMLGTSTQGKAGFYLDKGNIDSPSTYSISNSWSYNQREGINNKVIFTTTDVSFNNPPSEIAATNYIYFYYFIGR